MDKTVKTEELLSLLENFPNEKKELGKILSDKDNTVTKIATFVYHNFEKLYKAAGQKFCDWVINSFSPEVWRYYDILINPKEYDAPGLDDDGIYIAVCDGTVKTRQAEVVMVTYYGDVDLDISAGSAIVSDSKHEVHTSDWAELKAMGHTRVSADHVADLKLYDYSRATVKEAQLIYAAGNSYLESQGGCPKITVEENAQYLISGGRPEIIHKEGARGVIGSIRNGKLSYGGDGLLFFFDQYTTIDMRHTGGNILFVTGYPSDEVKEWLIDAIIPHKRQEQLTIGSCIQQPLSISTLRNDLLKLLKKGNEPIKQEIRIAKDEKEVAAVISHHIPTLVNNGLDGKFLRAHFTFDALTDSNIHVDEDDYHAYKPTSRECQYVFGSQLVNTLGHPQKVICYENATLIANNNEKQHVLNQNATAFGMGSANFLALDTAKAFGADCSRINAADETTVVGLQSTTIESRGDVRVRAFDDATVESHDHCQIVLFHHASIKANDHCQVIALDCNDITASKNVKVAQLTYKESSHPIFSEASEIKEPIKLPSDDAFNHFLSTWENEKNKRHDKSTILKQ